jgi:hypothetical protein
MIPFESLQIAITSLDSPNKLITGGNYEGYKNSARCRTPGLRTRPRGHAASALNRPRAALA